MLVDFLGETNIVVCREFIKLSILTERVHSKLNYGLIEVSNSNGKMQQWEIVGNESFICVEASFIVNWDLEIGEYFIAFLSDYFQHCISGQAKAVFNLRVVALCREIRYPSFEIPLWAAYHVEFLNIWSVNSCLLVKLKSFLNNLYANSR